MNFIFGILAAIAEAAVKPLLARWFNRDPEMEALQNALKAKTQEAETMAAPDRDKPDIIARMRQRELD